MKSFDFGRCLLHAGAIGALLTGCSGSQPIGLPGAMQQNVASPRAMPKSGESSGYKVLYSFDGLYTDEMPRGGVIAMDRKLYGTTSGGYDSTSTPFGTVFRVDPATGSEKVLHYFQGEPDGSDSKAGLIAVNGRFYGTTSFGGTYGAGTVFSISPAGKEKVLHSFGEGSDGQQPVASLLDVNSTLYGTTFRGSGSEGPGTVFSVTMQGVETVLHHFSYYDSDGTNPEASLIYDRGVFYGTTVIGGSVLYQNRGGGTVFRITPRTSSGNEKVLYSFDPLKRRDGFWPSAALIKVNGTLYGTTTRGGFSLCGTVFRMSITGNQKVLHSFGSGPDGCTPYAGLLDVKGQLYGTTAYGGAYGGGTVFRINPRTGIHAVLYSFGYGSDGLYPQAGLTEMNGTLYGTTLLGGTNGKGTVFALTL